MITNTPSFQTNFQALPVDTHAIPESMAEHINNYMKMPEDIHNYIKGFIPNGEDIENYKKGFPNVAFDKASQNKRLEIYKNETENKIGLYGENLILKGLPLCNDLIEIKKEWNTQKTELANKLTSSGIANPNWSYAVQNLFNNAVTNPSGKSLKALNALYYTSYCAAEALEKIAFLSSYEAKVVEVDSKFSTQIQDIERQMEKIRQQRNTEKTIYNVCGGKTKFHDLKILPWKGVKNFEKYTSLKQIQIGETVMRGLDSSNRPFIAISMHGQRNFCDFKENIITVIQQVDSEDPTKWFNHGTHGGLLYNSQGGSFSRLGIKTGEIGPFSILGKNNMEYDTKCYVVQGKSDTRIDNLFATLQQLLTTGNCPYDYKIEDMNKYYESIGSSYKAENCYPAMFKLKEQM